MNDLITYFAENETLLTITVALCAITVFLMAVFIIIGTIKRKADEKKSRLANDTLLKVFLEKAEFKTEKTEEGFVAALVSCDEVLVKSEVYSSLSGAKSALKSLKNNIDLNNFTVFCSDSGEYFVKVTASNGAIGISPPQKSVESAKQAIEIIKAASIDKSVS